MNRKKSRFQDDTLKSYFEQIKKAPLLTFEEECDLSKRIQKGEDAARNKLIESNLRLVVKIAKTFTAPDVSLIDLVQEGNLGLMKAASRYDYRKNVRFSTYASWWIRQSIARSLSNKRRSIRLPHRKEDALKKIQQSYTILSQKLMRKPSMEEVAKDLRMQAGEVAAILTMSNSVISLDSEINDDNGTLIDLYEDNSYAPDREIMQTAIREETMNFLERLMDKEKQILLYRFSFYGGKKYTLKRIGEVMGMSAETVRQIEMRALRKLKENAEDLRGYVYH